MYLLQAATAPPYNWPTVIASVIGGGLISSIISFFASRQLKQAEFNYDYRKYILEKRKTSYDAIEEILVGISAVEESDKKIHALFVIQSLDDPFRDFNNKIFSVITKDFWISNRMRVELLLLNEVVVKMMVQADRREAKNDDQEKDYLIEVGTKFQTQIQSIAERMTKLFFEEIIELNNFKKFKKQKQ